MALAEMPGIVLSLFIGGVIDWAFRPVFASLTNPLPQPYNSLMWLPVYLLSVLGTYAGIIALADAAKH